MFVSIVFSRKKCFILLLQLLHIIILILLYTFHNFDCRAGIPLYCISLHTSCILVSSSYRCVSMGTHLLSLFWLGDSFFSIETEYLHHLLANISSKIVLFREGKYWRCCAFYTIKSQSVMQSQCHQLFSEKFFYNRNALFC